jgi:GntR family transcriptional regulator
MRMSADHVFYPSHLRICFVECNTQDIEAMTRELRSGVGRSMEGTLLSDVIARSDEIGNRFDLIVTSFFHLSQVIQSLGAERQKKVVGVNAVPDHAALLSIARLHSPVIGLVCELPSVMETLTHIIQTYHASATIIPALFEEEPRLKTLIEKADVIVVPLGVSKRLLAFNPKIPVITVAFTIEQQSIDFLAGRIRELEESERKTSDG